MKRYTLNYRDMAANYLGTLIHAENDVDARRKAHEFCNTHFGVFCPALFDFYGNYIQL